MDKDTQKKINKEIGKRLEEELRRKYDSVAAGARALGAQESSYFTPYVTGRNGIGKLLYSKLEKIGIDTHYIKTGERLQNEDNPAATSLAKANKAINTQIEALQRRLLLITTELESLSKALEEIRQ